MRKVLLSSVVSLCVYFSYSQSPMQLNQQDTLHLTMADAETLFLNKNLSLIAQKYSIDSARAAVITAKLYDNPEINFTNAFYNSVTHRFFESEQSIQISQLIKLAGKRNKLINLSNSGLTIQEFQFYDLLRNLKFVLRNDFYNIYFLEQSSKLYQLEINSLLKIVPVFEEQIQKGFLAPKDLIRIKSQLYTLQAEFDGLQTNIDNVQAEFKLIIRANATDYIYPLPDLSSLQKELVATTNYQSLIDTALNIRPDLKALYAGIEYSNYNLKLQKAYAIPDITLSVSYDRLGGYVKDYNAIGIGFPLPFFNRNQGNIRNAKIQVETNKIEYENSLDKVISDVTTNYISASRSEKLLMSFDPKFDVDLENLIQQVFINYQKKNITTLEFLDFYDSYKQNVLQLNQLRYNRVRALEQLNCSVGKTIFNP